MAPRLKCYKNASRLNRYNFPTDNAIDFLLSTLHTTPFHYEVMKKEVGSVIRWDVIAIQTRCIFITFKPWGNFRGNCPILYKCIHMSNPRPHSIPVSLLYANKYHKLRMFCILKYPVTFGY